MALYQYLEINKKGKKIKKIIAADNIDEALIDIKRKDIIITNIEQYKDLPKLKISKEDILNFTHELARLLRAGLPLYNAINALKDKYNNQ